MAFGDVVVPNLKGMAKAIFSGGRFVAVSDGVAVFSLDNAPTRDRAEKYRADVEARLGTHFGTPVPMRLIIESEAGAVAGGTSGSTGSRPTATSSGQAAASTPAGSAGAAGDRAAGDRAAGDDAAGRSPARDAADADDAELIVDVDELEDADVASTGVDRLTAAFPGAELIEKDEGAR